MVLQKQANGLWVCRGNGVRAIGLTGSEALRRAVALLEAKRHGQ